MSTQVLPAIVQAAQSANPAQAALAYCELGFSILPLVGKRPSLDQWQAFRNRPAGKGLVGAWIEKKLLQNVGLVCGTVSGNLVVLDLDGAAGYPAFAATFPQLAQTYTVATGGGIGKHVYWRVEELPPPIKAMKTPIGNLEICSEGRQVVAPPSIHPDTKQPYKVDKPLEILKVPNLNELVEWVEAFKPKVVTRTPAPPPVPIGGDTWLPPQNLPTSKGELNPRVIAALTHYFAGQGYKSHGDWLHGPCPFPHNHKHGDQNPSFGFHTTSGYGNCYVCGTLLAKDICAAVGLYPENYGGLMEGGSVSQPPKPSEKPVSELPKTVEPPQSDSVTLLPPQPPAPPSPDLSVSINDLKLPSWLQQYVDWAGTTGNQTPMMFHLAAGLWLLSVSVGRRLYGAAPWGVDLHANLYMMMIAGTTYYRKSTAYKLAEQVARAAIPHMLMPTPGSPERFQEALSGRLPANFDKLTPEQQHRQQLAQRFAAQRGLLKDEIAGLFGAINRKDYMFGVKDLIMELYDCPEYSDKDTQTGLTIVEKAGLSILGVTTPDGLGSAISLSDWSNGLLVRFALVTPEPDYTERPALTERQVLPPALITGLRRLHDKLPQPEEQAGHHQPPRELAAQVDCWGQCQRYSDHLRQFCRPDLEVELDERLKGVYGRLHVQAFKVALLLSALDWLESNDAAPTVTVQHWVTARQIAELWRQSSHRLLEELDRNGVARREHNFQTRMLQAFQQGGANGRTLRDVYRQLHLPAKQARQMADDLVLAGLLIKTSLDGAEGYLARLSPVNS